jgi:hypothetical protein
MKNGTLQLDEAMTAYLEYAAAIDGNTVKNFLSKLRRQFNALHPSVKLHSAVVRGKDDL